MKVLRKPNNRKWVQPHAYTWKLFCPPAIISLALKISQVLISQVWSITLLLPERISPHSAAKLQNFLYSAKKKQQKFGSYEKNAYLCSVKTLVLTIQVSFLRGQAVYVTTQFIKPYIECAALIFIWNYSSSFSGIPCCLLCFAWWKSLCFHCKSKLLVHQQTSQNNVLSPALNVGCYYWHTFAISHIIGLQSYKTFCIQPRKSSKSLDYYASFFQSFFDLKWRSVVVEWFWCSALCTAYIYGTRGTIDFYPHYYTSPLPLLIKRSDVSWHVKRHFTGLET